LIGPANIGIPRDGGKDIGKDAGENAAFAVTQINVAQGFADGRTLIET
jgi:hypothetical protein